MLRRYQKIAVSRRATHRPWPFLPSASPNLLVFLVAAILHAEPASAVGPRDDVIGGMFRCAAVGDTRLWLDCFYGAAQPMRAALNLPPVLPAQARLAQHPPAGAPSGDPSIRYQTTSEVLRCNSVSQDRQWLDCYYAAAQPVRAALGLSPAPQAHPQLPAETATKPSANPGAARGAVPVGIPFSSRMASYSFNSYGLFTVELANGQTWRQLSGDTSAAHWTKPAPNYTVRISRGALRSFNLKVAGNATEYKVERIN